MVWEFGVREIFVYFPKSELFTGLVDGMITMVRADSNVRNTNKEDIKDLVFSSITRTIIYGE